MAMTIGPRSVVRYALSLALLALLALLGCQRKDAPKPSARTASSLAASAPAPSPALPAVTIGIQTSPAMTLVMVAKDEGFFERAGVNVELKEFTAGKFALQAFLSGSLDFAVSGEVPVVLAALQGNSIRVVTQVVEKTTNEVRVVARRDGKLTRPAEYFKAKKRKLATSFGGGPEFYTYNFLKHYGIAAKSVEIISQKPEDMPLTLLNTSVDAIAIFDPFAFIAESRMGAQSITFTDEGLYSEFYVLDAHPEQVEKRPELIRALLTGLQKASEFTAQQPGRAKQILARYSKLEPQVIDGIWQNFVFKPGLTQQLLAAWQAQAEWAKDTKKVASDKAAPDFRTLLEPRFLREVAPEAVQYQ